MKVLIINTRWEGASTGKIATGFYHKLIENGHQAVLLYGDGSVKSEDPNIRCIDSHIEIEFHRYLNYFSGFHGTFAPLAMSRLKNIIKKFKPDIVQLYNLHGYYLDIYKLFAFLKENDIPTVYGMLDEHPYLGYCCYAYDCEQFKTGCMQCTMKFEEGYLKSKYFNRARETFLLKQEAYSNFNNIIYTGPEWVINRAKESLLLKDKKLEILDEYVETDNVFYPRDTKEIRNKLSISEDKIIILNVGPSENVRKGIQYYIEAAKKTKRDDIVFINVGYTIDKAGLPSNYIPIPYVSNQDELALYYSLADLFVCTSIADTMPNVCLDSLACGTPVCGFNITGIPYVAEEPLGYFVEPGNVDELLNIIHSAKKKDEMIINECREYALQRYSPESYYERTMDIYNKLLNGR